MNHLGRRCRHNSATSRPREQLPKCVSPSCTSHATRRECRGATTRCSLHADVVLWNPTLLYVAQMHFNSVWAEETDFSDYD